MKKFNSIKLKEAHKKNIKNASIFILGVLGTLTITKLWNQTFPESPLVVKEVNDSIKIVHEYKIPNMNDSLEGDIQKKIKNLELLNNYEDEIDNRIRKIEKKASNAIIPNLVSLDYSEKYEYKGFTQGSANAFFTLDCPDSKNKFLEFKPDFFNPAIIKEIAFLRLNIYKFDKASDKESKYSYLTQFYRPKDNNSNFIRIENGLSPGKYEVFIGFTLKKDLKKEYPTFYFKRCILNKN